MKNLVKLVRLSSKEAFLKLRTTGEINCKAIQKDFKVTNLFLRHISGSSKNRKLFDIVEILSCINLIEKISNESELIETRKNIIIEGKRKFNKTFKVKSKLKSFEFFLILGEKQNGELILISIFKKYGKK